jgi:superfamily II DNA or RNA helicase
MNNLYKIYIYERYKDLKNSNKKIYDNNNLSKIFEYYTCIELEKKYNKPFYEYNDIDPIFKEDNNMSQTDTGVDCCDLIDSIVQCKLRSNSLTFTECSTFFAHQNIYDDKTNQTVIRWKNLIIARNDGCKLAKNLKEKKKLFIDITFDKKKLLSFCEELYNNPPTYPVYKDTFILRDYQKECIKLIKNNNKNIVINLPTGTGKNSVIVYSIKNNLKYLILVPRIILMEQLYDEIIKHKPKYKNKIQFIGDANNVFNENKLITICVYNSVNLIENYFGIFDKIFIDEAHHIITPSIYYDYDIIVDNDDNSDNNSDDNSDNNSDDESDDVIDNNSDNNKKLTYTQIIKNLTKYNNNVYLSATIDEIDNFMYYSKDIREMIELNYLCDYIIKIPVFSDDPTNKNICDHLIKNYTNTIIYCNSHDEGKKICNLLNKIQKNIASYIDCETSKTQRQLILQKYRESKTQFLVNVKILVEGFDAPITKNICFMHLPKSKTTLIQIIGRALRLHPLKNIANIILPFSSNDDEDSICNFLKIISQNDSKIKKSYENKKLGGYIDVINMCDEKKPDDENNNDDDDDDDDDDDEGENDIFEFRFDLIYDSLGKLQNREEIWMMKFNKLKQFLNINQKRPNRHDNKILNRWLEHQIENYAKKNEIMKNDIIRNIWNEFINNDNYKKYFITKKNIWYDKFDKLKKHLNEYHIKPTKNSNKLLYTWLKNQIHSYKAQIGRMKDTEIFDLWSEFINNDNYKKYFITPNDAWKIKLNELKNYLDSKHIRPRSNGDNKILCTWTTKQICNYKTQKEIMSDTSIYDIWTAFINNDNYKKYFLTYKQIWFNKFNDLKNYLNKHTKRPNMKEHKLLCKWIQHQFENYKKETQIMKDTEIYDIWTEFIHNDSYKKYFQANIDKMIV